MITTKQCIEMLQAKLDCLEKRTESDYTKQCKFDCTNCILNYKKGTLGEHKEALKMAIEFLQMISEYDKMNQFKLFTVIFELLVKLENPNLLKIISDNCLESIAEIKEKEKILVDNTDTYKFDDTKICDD